MKESSRRAELTIGTEYVDPPPIEQHVLTISDFNEGLGRRLTIRTWFKEGNDEHQKLELSFDFEVAVEIRDFLTFCIERKAD